MHVQLMCTRLSRAGAFFTPIFPPKNFGSGPVREDADTRKNLYLQDRGASLGYSATVGRAFVDKMALHICNLGKDGRNQFTCSITDEAQTVNVERYAFVEESTNSGLNVDGITTQMVHSVHMKRIIIMDEVEKIGEARAVSSNDCARYAFIEKFSLD